MTIHSDSSPRLSTNHTALAKGLIAVLALLVTLGSASAAFAQGAGPFGLGLVLGEPSGLTGKYWMDGAQAVQGHLAFSLDEHDRGRDYVVVIADYLYHIDVFNMRSSSVDLPIYVGIGGKVSIRTGDDRWCQEHHNSCDSDLGVGVRIPIGLDLLLRKAPLEFFLEIVPGLRVIPSTDGDVDAGLGARYYF